MANDRTIWLLPGVRTPFARVDKSLADRGAIELGVPVMREMTAQLVGGARVDACLWGSVIPNLTYSNIARETWLDAGLDPTIVSASVVQACCTSKIATFEAAGLLARGAGALALVGGAESMTHIQMGLSQRTSDLVRRVSQARSWKERGDAVARTKRGRLGFYTPTIKNRTTGQSMGEGCEEMAKTWSIDRSAQDEMALFSHRQAVLGQERGFFDSLVIEVDGSSRDAFPRRDTSIETLAKLPPAFDRTSGRGTISAGNSSPLTDGAAGLWVATDEGLRRLPSSHPRVKLIDFELAAVDMKRDGLLMAPAYAIPRLLARHRLRYEDIGLYEIHEAFSAQLLCHLAALESERFVRDQARVEGTFGRIPRDRINPNGGSVALGHPFAATGARILAQAAKELAAMAPGTRALVSVCADGGLGTVALLEAA